MEMKDLVRGYRRQCEGRMGVDRFGLQRILAALDREHHVGFCCDDRLVGDDLVAVIARRCALTAAGQRMISLAAVFSPAAMARPFEQRHHEHHADRLRHLGAQFAQMRQIVRDRRQSGTRRARSAPMAWPTSPILSSSPCSRKRFGHQHQRHLRRLQDIHGFLRARIPASRARAMGSVRARLPAEAGAYSRHWVCRAARRLDKGWSCRRRPTRSSKPSA